MTRSVVSHGSERVARANRTLASAGGGRAVHVLVGVLAVGVVLPLGSTVLGVYDHVQGAVNVGHVLAVADEADVLPKAEGVGPGT